MVDIKNNWVDVEFSTISLGDKRLDRRAIEIAKSFSSNPSGTIPNSCKGWSETHAAYCFFSNHKVTAKKILAPHIDSTLKRASEHKVVLAIQDTTSMNFTGLEATSGLGEVGDSKNNNAKGLINHNTYLVSEQGVPLGLIDQDIWARKTSKFKDPVKRAKGQIIQKESMKWLRALRKTSDLTKNLDDTCIVHIADREADIYNLFEELKELKENFIVRAKSNRRINKKSRGSEDGQKLFSRLDQEKAIGTVEIEVNDSSSSPKKRVARLELKALSFTLTPPRAKSIKDHNFKNKKISLTIVSAKEVLNDGISEPINWTLLTNTKIESADQILYCVMCYAKRWTIEVYHRILKTGCRVESIRFNSAEKIKMYAAFLAVIAWNIHWITLHARQIPNEKADLIFSLEDQEILQKMFVKKKRGRKKQLTVKDCLILVGRLGGFLARKSDGLPGAEVLWRGLTRLHELKYGLELLNANDFKTYV